MTKPDPKAKAILAAEKAVRSLAAMAEMRPAGGDEPAKLVISAIREFRLSKPQTQATASVMRHWSATLGHASKNQWIEANRAFARGVEAMRGRGGYR